jgi:single-stranded DNA-binding protein
MAVDVSFTGYVQEVKVFGWGVVAKVVHNQVKKSPSGEWETVGKDWFDVTLPDGVTVEKNQRVTVTGRFKSREYTRKDGSKGLSLEVRASAVTADQVRPVADDLPF